MDKQIDKANELFTAKATKWNESYLSVLRTTIAGTYGKKGMSHTVADYVEPLLKGGATLDAAREAVYKVWPTVPPAPKGSSHGTVDAIAKVNRERTNVTRYGVQIAAERLGITTTTTGKGAKGAKGAAVSVTAESVPTIAQALAAKGAELAKGFHNVPTATLKKLADAIAKELRTRTAPVKGDKVATTTTATA